MKRAHNRSPCQAVTVSLANVRPSCIGSITNSVLASMRPGRGEHGLDGADVLARMAQRGDHDGLGQELATEDDVALTGVAGVRDRVAVLVDALRPQCRGDVGELGGSGTSAAYEVQRSRAPDSAERRARCAAPGIAA